MTLIAYAVSTFSAMRRDGGVFGLGSGEVFSDVRGALPSRCVGRGSARMSVGGRLRLRGHRRRGRVCLAMDCIDSVTVMESIQS